MKDKYSGAMKDSFFRRLDESEEKDFRRWTRKNYVGEVNALWHPVVRDEARKIDQETIAGTDACAKCGAMKLI